MIKTFVINPKRLTLVPNIILDTATAEFKSVLLSLLVVLNAPVTAKPIKSVIENKTLKYIYVEDFLRPNFNSKKNISLNIIFSLRFVDFMFKVNSIELST